MAEVSQQYRRKRAMRDEQTLNLQRNRALAIIEGEKLREEGPIRQGHR